MSFVSLTGLSSTLKAMLSNKTIEPNDGSTPCIEITDIKYEIFMVRIMIEVTFVYGRCLFYTIVITDFMSPSF